ncbi:TonB-dependent receptor domain-containing protein [Echinimonas agarilytica]|uniref:TonB-dependent receptor n=1 Tax=Echinimonas agarilytica TaxID=1215918 RepID=A0AA42B8W9_9GAMM|nr:TonB-dependent receptor [Echinimonas agarilytica]MCM2681322.1 TonB-dependent receptor [Echinimonas agarilytica]
MTNKHTLAVAIAAAFALPVLADDAPANTTESIEITGKRVAYSNNATDQNMANYSSAAMSVNDIIDMLPGITVGEGGAFGGDDWSTTISMRGFSLNLNEQQIGVTIDNVPNGGSSYGGGSKANRFIDGENLQAVEVSQGTADIASASLDALGGTLNYVSVMPKQEREVEASIIGGDHSARRYFVRYDTGEIAKDTYAYFSISDQANDRWIGSGSNGESTASHFEAKITSDLDWVNLTARFSYDDSEEDNYNGVSIAGFDNDPRWDGLTWAWTGNPDLDQNFAEAWSTLRENYLTYVKAEFVLADNISADFTPYHHYMEGRGDWLPPYQAQSFDADGNPVNKGGVSNTRYYYLDANGNQVLDTPDASGNTCGSSLSCYGGDESWTRVSSYRHTHYEKTRIGATANLTWDISFNSIRAGFWVENQDRDEHRDWHNVVNPEVYHHYDNNPYWVQYDRNYETDTFKYYLSDRMTFGDLVVTAGIQQYLVEITRKDELIGQQTGKLDSDSDVLPSLGAVYGINSEWEVFAGYSENFKPISDAILETDQDFKNLDGEEAKNYELGLRFYGTSLQASVVYYNSEFKNRITRLERDTDADEIDFLNELDGTFVNVGGIDSSGFEASLNWDISNTLSLYSSATLNDSEYNKTVSDYADGLKQTIVKGNKVAGAPEEMFVLSMNYSDDAYRAGLSAKYTGDYYGDFDNQDEIEAHTVMDLYLGYNKAIRGGYFNSIDLSLNVNNLLDEEYLAGGVENYYFIGAERTATATATVNF